MEVFLGLIFFFLLFSHFNASSEKCQVLVMGGGGDRGAWEVGTLQAILENEPTKQWQIVSGTSIGGINSVLFGQSKIGEEKEGVNYLLNFWENVSKEELYRSWTLGLVEGFLDKSGLYDTTPCYDSISKYLNHSLLYETDRYVEIGTTILGSGLFKSWHINDESLSDIASELILGGCSIPGVFPPVKIETSTPLSFNEYLVDGGVSSNAPVTSPIEICQKLFPERQEIVVDVVYCIQKLNFTELNKLKLITPLVLLDAAMDIINNLLFNDIQYAKQAFPNVKINIFVPTEVLPGYFIGFDHDEIMKMIQIGYDETNRKLKKTSSS